jgi:peptidase E
MRTAVHGHVVALGGGGFSMEPNNPLLDDFILSLSPRQPARVCFVPTASADSATYIARFYRAFAGKCIATDLTLFDAPALPRHPAETRDLADYVREQDIFYVGGGSTANLLAIWRAHGLDSLLRKAWRAGAVMSGISAGMLCWFQGGLTDSFGGLGELSDGLGLIKGYACPHYDGEPERRAAFHKLMISEPRVGWAADDGVALHFAGTRLEEVVSSRPSGNAYRVQLRRSKLVETPLAVRYLGSIGRDANDPSIRIAT